jgi:hypothetical protein
MTSATANLSAFLAIRGLDPDSSTLRGVQLFVPLEERSRASPEAGFGNLAVEGPGGDRHPIPREDPAFGEACAAVRGGFGLERPWREPSAPGETAFSFGCSALIEVGNADRAFRRATMSGDRDAAEEAAWVKFRHGRSFRASPCTREEFIGIRREAIASDHLASMGLSDYYDWWRESLAHVAPDGELTDAAREAAGRLLDAWLPGDRDLDSLLFWTCRNIEPPAHPRHKPLFQALVEERLAELAPPSP